MKNKGITLIALIITVIVLLILAGTAVSIAINGGDIFNKASQARAEWNTAVATEETKINEVLNMVKWYSEEPGLYDFETHEQKYTWQELIDNHIINLVGTEIYGGGDNSKINGYLIIDDSVTAITNGGFSNCSTLKGVKIGNGVSLISNSAFQETGLTSIIIPECVEEISNGAFKNIQNLTKVQIKPGVKIISNGAFNNCHNLAEISIPNTVNTISGFPFGAGDLLNTGAYDTKTVVFEEGIETLGNYALGGLSGDVYLPKSITSISGDTTSIGNLIIHYAGTQAEWNNISKDSSWDSITILYEGQ